MADPLTAAERVVEQLNGDLNGSDDPRMVVEQEVTASVLWREGSRWGTTPGDQAHFVDGSTVTYQPDHPGGDWVAT